MARTASGKRRASEADRHSSDSRAGRQDGAQAVEVAPKVQEMQLGMAASESQKGLRGRAMSAASVSRPKRKSDDDSGFRFTESSLRAGGGAQTPRYGLLGARRLFPRSLPPVFLNAFW